MFHTGDIVQIVDKKHSHDFDIGEYVKIIETPLRVRRTKQNQ